MKKYLKREIKIITQKIIRKIIRKIVRDEYFLRELSTVKRQQETLHNNSLLDALQSVGDNVKLNGKTIITDPQSVSIGHNVHIGDDAHFSTQGGLTIGDNTHISRNVTIYTLNHNYLGKALPYDHTGIPKPVAIGKNVWIGMNVSIIPGVRIGDGAVIGMGTVVTHDVPTLGIVGNQSHRILKHRNSDHYDDLEQRGCYGGVNGKALGTNILRELKTAEKPDFFVLTTGRSGSTTISDFLSKHSKITCVHEPRKQLIRLSTEFAHGEKTKNQVQDELFSIYCNSSRYPDSVYGESDQKFWNLVPIVAELFPNSKFIWLIRDGRDVISSTCARRWFDQSIEEERGNPTSQDVIDRWLYYRLNGGKCGAFNSEKWDEMSFFERNCWYWSHINTSIKNQLNAISRDRWQMVKLEELTHTYEGLIKFLGMGPEYLELPKSNAYSSHRPWYQPKKAWSTWNEQENLIFSQYCGDLMNEWYPSWQQKALITQ